MTLEFHGLAGWAISSLCLIAIIVGLIVIIDYIVERGHGALERARLKNGLTGEKLRYLIEGSFGKEQCDAIVREITDERTTLEHFTMVIDNIKSAENEPTHLRRVEQPAG